MKKFLQFLASSVVGLLLLVLLVFVAGGSQSAFATEQVCSGGDSGKIDVGGGTSLTVSAPDGFLIDGYCVKAGSTQQGNGPVYVSVDPPSASVTITHPSGKDISHYSLTFTPVEEEPPPTEEPTEPVPTEPTPTDPVPTEPTPTEPPPTEEPPTEQPPTEEPSTEQPPTEEPPTPEEPEEPVTPTPPTDTPNPPTTPDNPDETTTVKHRYTCRAHVRTTFDSDGNVVDRQVDEYPEPVCEPGSRPRGVWAEEGM